MKGAKSGLKGSKKKTKKHKHCRILFTTEKIFNNMEEKFNCQYMTIYMPKVVIRPKTKSQGFTGVINPRQ